MIRGTESPTCRLNPHTHAVRIGRALLLGGLATTISPWSQTNSTDGTCMARIPRPSISARPSAFTAAAV